MSSIINEFVDVLDRLQEQHPEFMPENRTSRAQKMIDEVFHVEGDREKSALPQNTVEKNMQIFVLRVNAILDQIVDNPIWQNRLEEVRNGVRETVAATIEEWRSAPATSYKTFQKKLTDAIFRLDFERKPHDAETADFSNMVVDPAEIDDTILQNLGLIPKPQKGSTGKRLSRVKRVERNVGFIPAIKAMLQRLEPFRLPDQQKELELRCFRLFRIGEGPNKGFVLGAQSINRDDYTLFKTDLYGALRRIGHIKEGYERELALLIEIQTTVSNVWNMIDKDWPDARERIPEIREQLLDCVDKLKKVTNEHKVMMKEKIEKFVDIKCVRTVPAKHGLKADGTRGVVRAEKRITVFNPGAAKASFRSIPGLVSKRVRDMRNISGRLAKDEVDLKLYIAGQEKLFRDFYRRVQKQHQDFAVLNVNVSLSKENAARKKGNIQSLASQCDPEGKVTYVTPFFEPHLAFAEKMSQHLYSSAEFLDTDRSEAARQFMMAFLIAKIENFYVALEKFYRTELPPSRETADFNQLLKKLEALNGMIARGNVGTSFKTTEYDDIFGGIYHLLNSLKKRAREGRSAQEERLQINIPGTNPEELKEDEAEILMKQILMQMKNRIKEMRFDQLIRDGREQPDVSVEETSSGDDRSEQE